MRYLIIASFIWLAPVILDTTELSFGGRVMAAETKPEKRRVPPLKESTYKVLGEATALIDPESIDYPEDEPKPVLPPADPRAAIKILNKQLERRGINPYEIAQVWNTLAFAYYTLEDIPNTIRSYEKVLTQPQEKISVALELSTLRALFQLHFSEERYKKSIQYMDRWEVLNGKPDTNVTFIRASGYYQLEDFRNALKNALKVEQLALAEGKKIRENWLYLQVVLYNELQDTDNVIKVLENLIVLFPKKQYWMHLAGMYAEKELPEKSLSAYYAVYLQGMFAKESEIVMLSQRLLNAEVPFEAATVLEDGFSRKIVEKNEKNIRLLAAAYTMSQEYTKAIDAWNAASEFAKDGEIYYRLAQALANEDRHKEAVVAYNDALDKKGLRDRENVQFWMGISLMQLQSWDSAKKAFRAAAKDKEREKSARQYIQYINGEEKRLKALADMISA
ncbi:MAG: hypothetical protein KUG79_00370 [Pseudomonadales bacterium]|nr:hypothetical protein [Pseudomonadales bacterium]